MRALNTLLMAWLGGLLLGCLADPPPTDPPPMTAVTATDARGEPVALSQLPRRPRLTVTSDLAFEPDTQADEAPPPWLFTGSADPTLVRDLARLPLTAASKERLVRTRRLLRGHTAVIEPVDPLWRGALYTLATPCADAAHACSAGLQVDDSAEAGAMLSGSLPAAEATSVPSELGFAALAFDGLVEGAEQGVWLEDDAGLALPGHVESVDCAELESAAVSCMRWWPATKLAEGRRYALRSGHTLRDAHGAAVPEVHVSFTTAPKDAGAPLPWQPSTCALDERLVPGGCGLFADTSVQLRLFPSPTTLVRATLAGERRAALPHAAGFTLVWTGLQPKTPYDLALQVTTSQGSDDQHVVILTEDDLATLSISEVYADPEGPEPTQELVELLNFGPRPVSLAGLRLADGPSEPGTEVGGNIALAPGARALLVAADFDPANPLDQPPPAGSVLVRQGKTLTRQGLANAGETLYLRDASGRRLSGAPAIPPPRQGVCSVRVTSDPRSLAPGSFAYDAHAGCTPGY